MQKLSGKFHFVLRFCTRKRSKTYVRGLKFVSQLYHDGSLRSHKDITGTFGLTVMQTNSLLAAIQGYIRHPYVKSRIHEEMVMESVTSRKAYENIITNRTYAFAKFEKWQVILNDLFDFDEYLVCYRNITFITNVPKYRSFQYRLMSHAIITNVHLYRWKKRGMNVCSFCGLEKETYVHLFVECQQIRELWETIEQYYRTKLRITAKNVIFNQVCPPQKSCSKLRVSTC